MTEYKLEPQELLFHLLTCIAETTKNINLPSNNEPLYFLAGEDEKHVVTVGEEDLIFSWQNPERVFMLILYI